jgi:hypothetical protein
MPQARTVILLHCVDSPQGRDNDTWWLAETYMTSDGPRMRLLGSRRSEDEARTWMKEVEARLA